MGIQVIFKTKNNLFLEIWFKVPCIRSATARNKPNINEKKQNTKDIPVSDEKSEVKAVAGLLVY